MVKVANGKSSIFTQIVKDMFSSVTTITRKLCEDGENNKEISNEVNKIDTETNTKHIKELEEMLTDKSDSKAKRKNLRNRIKTEAKEIESHKVIDKKYEEKELTD